MIISCRVPVVSRLWIMSFLGLLLSTASCMAIGGDMGQDARSNIVAGHNEPDFNENFGLNIKLPIKEDEFCSILKSKDIEFRIVGFNGVGIPLPRHRQNVDLPRFMRMYEIYGGVDAERRMGKRFRAYIDDSGHVSYIENAFSYQGP